MSIFQLEAIQKAGEVDVILGVLYILLGSLGLLILWHFSHERRLLERQRKAQIRREWRALNLRGLN
ncbi:MAG: hypothetical protein JZU63_06380 [Rhodoferax sp.]|nr:hypothetical protein [Rhodoferax sp.]